MKKGGAGSRAEARRARLRHGASNYGEMRCSALAAQRPFSQAQSKCVANAQRMQSHRLGIWCIVRGIASTKRGIGCAAA